MSDLNFYAKQLGIELDSNKLSQFDTFAEMLISANKQFNLTAVTDREAIDLRHFADSMSVLTAEPIAQGASLIDVGCGAGFPSLPIKIARPDIDVTFLDSTAKKLGFIDNVCDSLSLENARTVCARAEELCHKGGCRESFDVVTARGVANLAALSEVCLPLCKVGGVFLALKGQGAESEISLSEKILARCGGKFERIHTVSVGGLECRVVVIRKIAPTPPSYPRRWAQIVKETKNV